MGRIGVATSPHAKAGRLPCGLSSRESLANRQGGKADDGGTLLLVLPPTLDRLARHHWQTVNETVRRLQARIVKATKAGKWHKVQALQHLLTHSFSGKALAVRRVTENQGKHTRASTGSSGNTRKAKGWPYTRCSDEATSPPAATRVHPENQREETSSGYPDDDKTEPCRPSTCWLWTPSRKHWPTRTRMGFGRNGVARTQWSNAATVLSNSTRPQWILEGDIKSCFDKISHDWLLSHIPMDKTILHKWLKAGYMDKSVLYPTDDGTPQGGIISRSWPIWRWTDWNGYFARNTRTPVQRP